MFNELKRITMNIQNSHSNSQMTHSNQATRLNKFYWSAALACTAVIGSILPVEAASFNFTHAPGTTLDQMTDHEMAGHCWSNFLANNISHNIFIDPANALSKNVIGSLTSEVIQADLFDFLHSLWTGNGYS